MKNNFNKRPSKLIVFDGVCNLCSSVVRFLVRLDRKKRFYFSPRDSKYLKSFDKLPKRGADESIYYLRGEEIYDRSDAVLYILKDLGWPFRLLTLFFVFPKSWRDRFYSWVARNRYRWFGQKSACMQPRQEVKDRFLF